METDLKNPFAGYGNIVFGEKFIRRPHDEDIIFRRIIEYREPGNLAVIGDHKVGKSSLVYNVIAEHSNLLLTKQVFPIWLNVASIDTAEDFFRALVNKSLNKLDEYCVLTSIIEFASILPNAPYENWTNFLRKIKQYFKIIRLNGYKILFILDEFDHTRNLFEDDKTQFRQ